MNNKPRFLIKEDSFVVEGKTRSLEYSLEVKPLIVMSETPLVRSQESEKEENLCTFSQPSQEDSEEEEETEVPFEGFKCAMCDKRFTSMSCRRRHQDRSCRNGRIPWVNQPSGRRRPCPSAPPPSAPS